VASTITAVAANVRELIHDTASGDYVIGSPEMYRKIASKSQQMTGKVIPGLAWSASALSLAGGAGEATFASAVQYDMIVDVKEAAQDEILVRLPAAEIERLREGGSGTGRPSSYYLRETSGTVLTCVFDTLADQNYTFDALLVALPSGTAAASTAVPYSDLMVRAIEKAVAIECLLTMTPDQREKLKINDSVVAVWQSDVNELITAERVRERKRMAVAHMPPQVW